MRLEVIDSIEALPAFFGQWCELMDRCPEKDFFLMPDWVYAWFLVFGDNRKPLVVKIYDDQELLAIAPFSRMNKGPIRMLTFTGQPWISDRMDLLMKTDKRENMAEFFMDWLFSSRDWDVLSLKDFAPFSQNPELLAGVSRKQNRRHILAPGSRCFYLNLEEYENFEDFMDRTNSKKARKKLREKQNRLNRMPNVRWDIHEGLTEELIEEMTDLDANRSKRGTEGLSFLGKPANRDFLRLLVQSRLNHENIRLFGLWVDGSLCAYRLMFLFGNKLHGYQTTFDQSMPRLSLGVQMTYYVIEYAFSRNYAEVDFLKGEEDYKAQFADQFRQNRNLTVYNNNWKSGFLYAYQKNIKPLRKKLKDVPVLQKLFPPRMRNKFDI